MAATPIFILGRHRSGTTWIANILASLPEIYAPTHESHRGVHESAFFSHLVRHCNHGRTEADLRQVKRVFECSDYFAMTGMKEGPEIAGVGAAGYFRSIMEAGARKQGAQYWLEKTPAHTLHARFLAATFPDAVFIAVLRRYRDVVASNVHGFGNPRSAWSWFRESAVTAVYEKVIARNKVAVIRYETLMADYEGTVHFILKYLGIRGKAVPRSRFHRNTSYTDARPRNAWWQSAAMTIGRWVVLPVPSRIVEMTVIRWRGRRPGVLPPWFLARHGQPGGGAGQDARE